MMRTISALGLAALLGGCAVGTDYRPPEATVAPGWRAAPTGEAPTIGAWWEQFDDPVLNGLITTALAQNLDIEQALARVDRARAAAQAAGAALLPAGQLEGQAARVRQSTETGFGRLSAYVPDFPRTVSQYEVAAGASWEIDLAGGLRRGREAAIAEAQAAEATGAQMRVTIAAEVADAYVRLRALQQRLEIGKGQLESAQRILTLTEQRHRLGEVATRELEQARTNAAGAEADLAPVRAGIEAQLNRLAVLAGREPQANRLGLDVAAAIPQAPLPGAGTPGDLLRRRPDLIAAERQLAATHARVGVALAEYYPKLSLSGLLGFQARSLGNLFTGDAGLAQGAVGLRWRLFDFQRLDAELDAARGGEREAIAVYRQAVLRAAEDVETSYAALIERLGEIALREREVQSAERARQMTEIAWNAGQISLFELIDAERTLLAARDRLSLARGEAARASIACFRALGGQG